MPFQHHERKHYMTCNCGNPDATWHGDPYGARTFCCDDCWAMMSNGPSNSESPTKSMVRGLIPGQAGWVVDVVTTELERRDARIAELEAKNAEWEQKARNWMASPEAAKRLDGYRELAARVAELGVMKQSKTCGEPCAACDGCIEAHYSDLLKRAESAEKRLDEMIEAIINVRETLILEPEDFSIRAIEFCDDALEKNVEYDDTDEESGVTLVEVLTRMAAAAKRADP